MLAMGVLAASIGTAAGDPATGKPIIDRTVTFSVTNLDRTAYGPVEQESCPKDESEVGATWRIAAHLVVPRSVVESHRRAVTVYVHGVAEDGDTTFHLLGVRGYDYAAEEARAGHASVVIDRIGYGPSTHPDGNDICIGADADIVHQVIGHLRAGDYGGPSFGRVALAGHSAGGLIAQVEASTFRDVDALAVLAYEDQGFRPFLLTELGKQTQRCGTAAGGYAPTFDDRGDAVDPADNTRAALLSPNADPRVVSAVEAAHQADPCGENPVPYIVSDPVQLHSVTVPVLLVYGADDALLDPSTAELQASHFGSSDIGIVVLPHTAHLLTLERTAPAFRSIMSSWLCAHGL
jgi:pimeloyl-ACP methyl ester carboxylesterase